MNQAAKYHIKTYGCQMNDLDSLQMGRLLKKEGYQAADLPEQADVLLINTCSIREKPSQKVYSDVGRFRSLKLKNPEMILGVTGCQAQAEGSHLQKRFPYLDLVLGPDQVAKLPSLIKELKAKTQPQITQVTFEKNADYRFLNLLPDESENEFKAFVTIQKGCDNFCSFCIVPYVRGREVCRSADEIVQEVAGLAQQGVKEVTLLGQNVNSYGMGNHGLEKGVHRGREGEISFARLLRRVAQESDIERIRFTTSHPKDLSDELIEEFRSNPKLAKHFHLPVQSGSDEVLERMYRGYTREHFEERLASLRQACPDLAVSTDIIVGFPGESEADFEATLNLLEKAQFDSIFSFNYSPRPKTTADLYFADDVAEVDKKARLARLQALQGEITLAKNQRYEGKSLEVLVEGLSKQGETFYGRSSQNHKVHFSSQKPLAAGQRVLVKITRGAPNSLMGNYCE